ncbi:MAG: TonB family protein [Sphingomonas sp.]
MYADRYAGSRGFKPASLGASLLVNAAVLVALIYAAPKVIPKVDPPLHINLLPADPPPPPPEPQPQPRVAHPEPALQPVAPQPRIVTPPVDTGFILNPPPAPLQPIEGLGNATGTAIAPPQPSATPMPPLVGAAVDPRYADALQPGYPPEERRAGNEGRVVVRVLIGVDGRVKQVEEVSATSDAFFAATRKQALTRWRFRPATRGDVPVESWKTMSVRFVLNDE